MSEESSEDTGRTDATEEEIHSENAGGEGPVEAPQAVKRRRFGFFKILLVVVLAAGALVTAQATGYVPGFERVKRAAVAVVERLPDVGNLRRLIAESGEGTTGERTSSTEQVASTDTPLAPVFSGGSAADLLSEKTLLDSIGKVPGDPSRFLLSGLDSAGSTLDPTDPTRTCPADPLQLASRGRPEESHVPTTRPGRTGEEDPRKLDDVDLDEERTPPDKKPPAIKEAGRDRGDATGTAERQAVNETDRPAPASAVKPKRDAERGSQSNSPKKGRPASQPIRAAEEIPGEERLPAKGKAGEAPESPEPDPEVTVEEKKPEKYLLPGSLKVNVKNYKGTKVTWALMIILDDSGSMAHDSKGWKPDRLRAALDFVGSIASTLTPGSKVAVRDFYCGGGRSRRGKCLSHMLYDWSDPPLKGFEERLKNAHPRGRTNPCLAAAFSLKKDFAGLEGLTPRVLIVTNGFRGCPYREVLRVIDRKGGRGKIRIDVVAVGMSPKRRRGYEFLAKKTGGVFLPVDEPSETKAMLSRYDDALNTPTLKPMEVRGEKSVVKINNGEEITLAPGLYTLLLPPIPGLHKDKRAVRDIKISSGDNNILNVTVRKGGLKITASKR